mgnify:CR=1 FL=1
MIRGLLAFLLGLSGLVSGCGTPLASREPAAMLDVAERARFVGGDDGDVSLTFLTGSKDRAQRLRGEEQVLSWSALRNICPAQEVEVDDPYHARRMRYRALPLTCVLDAGFAGRGGASSLRNEGLLLRALDGYTRPVSGRELLEPGAFLAYGEPDLLRDKAAPSPFSPIDRRQVDPSPFYLVWTGTSRGDPHETPWPYQLATIEIAPFEAAFPKTVPAGLEATDPGWTGYALFQEACASCHSINGQGGKIGPDLNIPRSIIEYRPIPQIRAYVRNPQATRYTSMPAHPHLTETDLDGLIAYFQSMSERKHDSRALEAESK